MQRVARASVRAGGETCGEIGAGLVVLLGIAYFRIQRWREAEAEFRAVLELSPADDYAHYALGRALEKQGRDAEANGHYKLASSLSPNSEHYAERIMELDREPESDET